MAEVILLGLWASPFSKRVELALKLKGVEYELIDEDLANKSEQLLKYNPVHKKVPVLLHSGKPIAESEVILEYIDETWKCDDDEPLLPRDTYERAQARFWARFIDDKLVPVVRNALFEQGEVSEKGMKESYDLLKVLENSINDIKGHKEYSNNNGDKVGFLDIIFITIVCAVQAFQEAAGKELLVRQEFPQLHIWADELFACEFISENMPDREKTVIYGRAFLEAKFGSTPK